MAEGKYITKGPFTFCCNGTPLNRIMQRCSEAYLIRASEKYVVSVYRIIKRYLIPFIVAVDDGENVVFVVVNNGDKDTSEIAMFINSLHDDRVAYTIEKSKTSEELNCIRGYRVAKSKFQIEMLSLQGEILIDEHKNVHLSDQSVIKSN